MKAAADAGLHLQLKVKKDEISSCGVNDSRCPARHHGEGVKEVCHHCVASMVFRTYNLEFSFKPSKL